MNRDRFHAVAIAAVIGALLGALVGFWSGAYARGAAGERIYEALDPRGALPERGGIALSPRLTDLSGKTVYLIRSWPTEGAGFDSLLSRLGDYLSDRYPDIRLVIKDRNAPYSRDDPRLWAELRTNADAFLYVAAPSATTTHYAIVWSSLLEEMRLPGVVLLFEPLIGVQRTSTELVRAPVRFAAIPYPADGLPDADLDAFFENVVDALTVPLTSSERETWNTAGESRSGVLVRGTSNEIQEFFRREGLSDGLPIVPPTRTRVDEMLSGTSHSPDEIVADSMAPSGLQATVEKVAINGVLAGCAPEHLPVLLASIDAFKSLDRTGTVRSTNSFALMQIVNGPIRSEVDMNSGTGLLGPGNRSNACIGRALRLFILNLGGGRVGENLMAQIGNVATYPFLFAENEERSPWPSFSVERGFAEAESTLTMMVGGVGSSGSYGPWSFSLQHVAEDIAEFEMHAVGATVIVTPPRAAELAAQGMSKEALKTYLERNAIKKLGELRTTRFFTESDGTSGQAGSVEVPVYAPGAIEVIVAGGHASPQMQAWNVGRPVTVSIDKWR